MRLQENPLILDIRKHQSGHQGPGVGRGFADALKSQEEEEECVVPRRSRRGGRQRLCQGECQSRGLAEAQKEET
eukprot:1757413-Rhodomonas_salina.1